MTDLLDIPSIQSMMDAFFELEKIGMAIIDLHGQVLVATGWQDICTKFHRLHPETCKHCIESDTALSSGVAPGEFKLYRCKNHMWDMVTPLVVGGRHVGNFFLGQFFFEDEQIDEDVFRAQARQYGFDEVAYLAALHRVPRWSREKIERVMTLFARFAQQISELGYRNLQLTRTLAAHKQAEEKIEASYALLRLAGETALFGGWSVDLADGRVAWSDEVAAIHGMPAGYSPATAEEGIAYYAPEWRDFIAQAFGNCATQGLPYDADMEILTAQGRRRWVRAAGVAVRDETGRVVKVRGSFQDITDHKRMNQALQESEEQYRLLVGNAQEAVYVVRNGKIAFANAMFARLAEMDESEVVGLSTEEFVAPEDRAGVWDHHRRLVAGETIDGPLEIRVRTRKGGERWVSINAAQIQWQKQPATLNFAADITARKQAEAKLRESEERFKQVAETAEEWIWEMDAGGVYTYSNPVVEQILGYAPEELVGRMNFIDLFPPAQREQIQRTASGRAARKEAFLKRVNPVVHKDGRIVFLETTGVPILDPAGNLTGYRGADTDVTRRMRAEEALQESEALYRSILNASPDDITLTDLEGRILMVSPSALKMFGHAQTDQMLGRQVFEFIIPGDRDRAAADIARLHRGTTTGPIGYRSEYRGLRADGVTFDIEVNGEFIRDANGQPVRMLLIVRDVTARKQAEEAVRQSEEKFSQAFRISPYAITLTRADDGRFIDVNEAFTAITGFSREEALADSSVGLGLWAHPRDRQQVVDDLRQGKPVIGREYPFRAKSGRLVPCLFSAQILRLDGESCILSSINDVTERNRAEAALRESEQRHRDYLAHSPYGIFVADAKGRLVQANVAACRITGFSEKELLSMTVPDLHGEEGRKEAARHFQSMVREGKATGELKFTTKSGESRWWLVSAVKISDDRFLGFCSDITDRKRAEERIQASEEQFRDISTNIPGVIYQLQTGRTGALEVTYMSAACEALFEQAPSGLDFSALLFDHMHPGDRALFQHSLAKAAKKMERWNLEFRILPAPNRTKWLRGSANPRKLPNGAVIWSGVLLDVTELKLAEQSLREREDFQNLLMDTIPSPVFYKDRQGRYLGFNKAFEAFYGKSKEQLIGKSVFDLAPPDLAQVYHAKDAALFDQPGTQIYEAPMRDAAGNLRDVVFHKASIVDAQGEVTGLIGIILDITERKRTEAKILHESALNAAIIDSIPGTFYMLDETGAYMRWSRYQRDAIVGKPEEQMAGISALSTIHPEDRGLFQARIANVLKNGTEEVVEGRVLLRGGPEFRWLLMTGRRMFVQDRPALIGIGIDITERKWAEEQVARQLDELRRWQTVTLGREGRVAELKREVNAFAARLGHPPPYPSAEGS